MVFAVLISTCLYAADENERVTHYAGLEGHIGYDNLMLEGVDLRNIGGVGGGIGLVYKMEYKNWRVQSGIEFTSLNSLSKGTYTQSYPVTDPYPTMIWHDQYNDVRYQRNMIAASIPLTAGYKWRDWTFAAGLRIGLPLWQKVNNRYDLTSTITDMQHIDDFHDMPNHGLTTTPYDLSIDKPFGIDLQAQAEVIWDLGFRELLHYEASVFAAVGLIDMDRDADRTRSLFVGAKFSIFYEFEHPKKKRKPSAGTYKKTVSHGKPIAHSPASRSSSAVKSKPQPNPPSPPSNDTVYFQEQVITKGEAVILNELYFATDQTTVLPESEEALETLYTFLSEHPDVRILIIGHTDNRASEKYNQRLSEGRAKAVAAAMIERGIALERLEAEGRGESEPIADNATEEGRQQNRRVEFVIL